MGNTYAATLAIAAADGELSRHAALLEHVRSNFWPSLDDEYADVAVIALDAIARIDHDPEVLDYVIALPADLFTLPDERHLYRSKNGRAGITVRSAMEILKLDAFADAAVTL